MVARSLPARVSRDFFEAIPEPHPNNFTHFDRGGFEFYNRRLNRFVVEFAGRGLFQALRGTRHAPRADAAR